MKSKIKILKHKLLVFALVFVMAATLAAVFLNDRAYAAIIGDGSETSPYLITSADELAQVVSWINEGTNSSSHYKLVNDIDLTVLLDGNAGGWSPIGNAQNRAFEGVFDGNSKKITGLYINTADDNVGLFGFLAGTVKNLALEDVNITGGDFCGAIAGQLISDAQITNCYVTGKIVGGDFCGAIAGRASDLRTESETVKISHCYVTAEVWADTYAGGITGSADDAEISDCVVLSEVVSAASDFGRITGKAGSNCVLTNNAAFSKILNEEGGTTWGNKGAANTDGEDMSAQTIHQNGNLGGRFLSTAGWTVQNGRLPGFGVTLPIPGWLDEGITVFVWLYIDGVAWGSHNKTFTLKLDTNENITKKLPGFFSVLTADVAPGVWKIYDGDAYTGVTIAVNTATVNINLNYFTVAFSVINAGAASGSTLSASYGGIDVANGSQVLAESVLEVTAHGAGADSYEYLWDGGGTDQVYTTTVNSAIDVECTVTGLTDAETPEFDNQPQSVQVSLGASATLSVVAGVNNGNLTYQWYRNTTNSNSGGTEIPGATFASYNPATSASGTSYYYVVVTNTDNSVTGKTTTSAASDVAVVIVSAGTVNAQAPVIGAQPANIETDLGEPKTFSVKATVTDGGKLSYQWFENGSVNSNTGGTAITGAESAEYTPPDALGRRYYYVVITNTNEIVNGAQTASTTSNAVYAAVSTPNAKAPEITQQPESKQAQQNQDVSLSVAAEVSDGGILSYQWYKNFIDSNVGGTLISGATSSEYRFTASELGSAYYYVVVTNTNNNVAGTKTASRTSNAVEVVVEAVPIIHAQMPQIDSQPESAVVNRGEPVTLKIEARVEDVGTLSYQWYSSYSNSSTGGTLIAGATALQYMPPTSTAGTFYYYVVVTNTNNTVNGNKTAIATSSPARIEVTNLTNASLPVISTQPQGGTADRNETIILRVAAYSPDYGDLTYQWYRNSSNNVTNGTLIAGATQDAYTPSTSALGTVYYYVEIKNTNNSVDGTKTASIKSNTAEVTVALKDAQTPVISNQPQNQTVYVNDAVTLSVSASVTDGGALSYQWYRSTTNGNTGGTLIAGATAASYTFTLSAIGEFYYYAVITNTNNNASGAIKVASVSSSAVTVTVAVVIINAQEPAIDSQTSSGRVTRGDSLELIVEASVTDGGTLTYQWYSNTANSGENGTLIAGATAAEYTPDTKTLGTKYYYAVVKNTNLTVNGTPTAETVSGVIAVTVIQPVLAAPTVKTKTDNGFTLNAVEPFKAGQVVQYAVSKENVAPTSGWQADVVFINLDLNVTYYIFARVEITVDGQAEMVVSQPTTAKIDKLVIPQPVIYALIGLGVLVALGFIIWAINAIIKRNKRKKVERDSYN